MVKDSGVSVGSLLARTFDTLSASLKAVALYIGVFSALGVAIELAFGGGESSAATAGGFLQFGLFLAAIVAQYFLIEAMLKQTGLFSADATRRYLPFLGQGILVSIGFVLGLILLIIPGLLLVARWSLASPLLVGEHKGAVEAIRESWELTRGHTVALLLAVLVLGLIMVVVIVLAAGASQIDETLGILLVEVAANAVSVIFSGFGVAAYGMLRFPSRKLTEVFE